MAARVVIRLGFPIALLLLTILSQHVLAEDKCRSGCRGGKSHVFKYAEGTTYNYNLEGSVDVTLSNAEGQQSNTKLKATVSLTQLSQCNQLLKLSNVQVVGPDAKKYARIEGVEKPIQINFHDGHVDDSICAEPGDNQNSLNIKRAVASIFQTAVKQGYETDVFGVCPTDISSHKEGANLIIQKSRNLNKCSHRETIKQDFLATAFNLDSEIKTSPVLTGEYTSEARIKNGILDHAVVTENYLFVPFSVGKNGAKATVTTKLNYVGNQKKPANSKVSQKKSIIFENPHLVNVESSNANEILKALKATKDTIELTVGDKTARSFNNLIKILRASNKDDILSVYGQVRAGAGFSDKVGAKKIFLDGIIRAGTGDTIEVAIELLKNKELSATEQKLVYLSLAFVKHATLNSLKSATVLLDIPNLPREGFLGVGTLAGRYCREHSCHQVPEVNALLAKLVSKLSGGHVKNRQQENQAVAALKALANVEHLSDDNVAKVVALAQDKSAPARVRVAALETLQVAACKDKARDGALHILKNIQEDSEIRINAYLVLAKCPNGKVANIIKNLIDQEPSHQVGGYIVSHLRSLKASANPDKQLAKHHLGQILTTKRFPIDLRKYSFYNEFSYTANTLGAASSAESSVIYSQNSFLPRSTNFNLTAQVFGHNFNFFEIGTRQENLDRLLEHYIGPLGVLNKASPEELVKSGKSSVEKLVQHIQQRLQKTRGKRDVSKQDIDNFGKQVQLKTNQLNTDLDLDLSVKIFGSELLFLSLNDQSAKYSPDALIDKIFDDIDDSFNKAKNFEKLFQSNIVFLDAEFSYPTSVGFPLRLSVEGSSALQLKAAGSVDVRALLNNDNSSPLKLSLIPSANIDIVGSLILDAQVVEGGLKVISSVYTATGGDLEVVQSNNGKNLDVKFSLPVQSQKLISATHEIVFHSRQLGQSEVIQPIKFGQNKDFSVCMDQLSTFIGVAFCADINSPPISNKHGTILPFPLSGNALFSVGIEREDLAFVHVQKQIYAEQGKIGGEFLIETIGANNQKKLGVNLQAYLVPEPYIKASLASQILSASLEGKVINTRQEKSLSLELKHDRQNYLGKIGVSVSGTPEKSVYKPLMVYQGPGQAKFPIQVEGAIIVEKQGSNDVKYIFDNVRLTSENPKQKPIIVQGNLGRQSNALFSDVTLSDGTNSGSLVGKLIAEQNVLNLNAQLKNTINPYVNVDIKYEYKREEEKRVSSNLQLIHGPDLSSKVNKLVLINSVYVDRQNHIYETENKIGYGALNFESSFDLTTKPKYLSYDGTFQYGNVKVGSDFEAKVDRKSKGDYDIEFEAYGFDNKVEIKSKREIVKRDSSKILDSLEINGKKYEVSGTVKHHYAAGDINLGTDLVVKIAGLPDALKIQSGVIRTLDELDTHAKVYSGSNIYVDTFLKANKGGNVNGNLKLNLKNFFIANGQLKATNGAGNGNIVVELVRMNRKIKFDSTFTISEPTYNVLLTIYPNFEKDNSKFVLTSNNQIKTNFVNSKNILELFGKKFELNLNGQLDGQLNNGKLSTDIELILPTNMYLSYKVNRELYTVNGISHGNINVVLEQRPNKNTPDAKIVLTGELKNANFDLKLFDVNYNLLVENKRGIFWNGDLAVKRLQQGDQIVVDVVSKTLGSLVKNQVLEVNIHSEYKGFVGTYKVQSKYGSDSSLLVDGKYDLDYTDNAVYGDVTVELSTPSTSFHVLKYSTSTYVSRVDNQLKLKGGVALFVDDNGSNPDATVDVKFSGEADVGPQSGSLTGTVNLQKHDPASFNIQYGISEQGTAKKLNGQLSATYGKNQQVKSEVTIVHVHEREYRINFKLTSPNSPSTSIQVHTKRSEDDKQIDNEIILNTNNKQYTLTSFLSLSKSTPGLSIKLVLPDGKLDEITAKLNVASEKKMSSDFKLALGQNNFLLEGTTDVNVESIDDFIIKSTSNSPALKINNLVVEISNKPIKGAKKIHLSVHMAGENVVSGSTSYRARLEGDKYIVEGSGSFKVKNEDKQGNFKLVHQTLSSAKNGEDGFEISLNGVLGNRATDSELKLTNKQFHALSSYCEEKQQCSHIEIDSKVDKVSADEFLQELEIAVDLRRLGLSHEFGLKGVTNRKNLVLDHTVDVYFQGKDNKYQYSLYVHPNEAGIQLTTPKRIVALESKAHGRQRGSFSGEVALYLDKKNKPDQKTVLSASSNCNGEIRANDCNYLIKLTTPALNKDFLVSYNSKYNIDNKYVSYKLVVDLLPTPNQKIVISGESHFNYLGSTGVNSIATAQIKSEGLNIDINAKEQLLIDISNYEIKYSYEVQSYLVDASFNSEVIAQLKANSGVLSAKALNHQLLNIHSTIQQNGESLIVNTDIELAGVPPAASVFESPNWQSFKYTLNRKESPNNKILIEGNYVPNDSANLNAVASVNGKSEKLASVKVALDKKNFLKTTSNVDSNNIQKYVVVPVKEDVTRYNAQSKVIIENSVKEVNVQVQKLVQLVQRNVPNFQPILDYYKSELQSLREELVSDKTIKEIGDFLKGIFGAVIHSLEEIIVHVNQVTEKVVATLQQQFARVVEIIKTQIIPAINKIAETVIRVGSEVIHQLTNIATAIIAKISLMIESHSAELKHIADILFGIFAQINQFIYNLLEQSRTVITKEWKTLYEEVKKHPLTEELKQKYHQFFGNVALPDTIINTVKQIFATIKDAVPSADFKKFVTLLGDYVDKKLKGEKVDDVASIKQILQSAAHLVDKLLKTFTIDKDVKIGQKTLPLSFDFFNNLPKLVSVKLSPLSYLINGDLPTAAEWFSSLSLHPLDWIPPYKLDAVIAQGQHIFTFDGRHLTFPGDCNYLLVRDAVNGNFSVAGSYKNGQLTTLVVSDKQNIVTLKNDGHVLINNEAVELPIHKGLIKVLRSYESIEIVSQAGVKVICGPELIVCGVHVSGFYHGQLRGLLGNGNFEPFDDFTLPNGKIVTSESDLGNGYKLSSQCADVKTVDHSVHHHNPVCNKLFASDSALSICYKFVNPDNYKMACAHGLAANVPNTEYAIATAYVVSCRQKLIPVHVPAQFVKCHNSEQPISVGDSLNVKTPGKAADIVVIVDQEKSNEVVYKDFVQPLLTQITSELGAKGINDIEFHVIGYGGGENQEHAAHYTVNSKLTFKGRSPVLKFSKAPQHAPIDIGCPKTNKFIEVVQQVYKDLQLATGQTLQEATYANAFKYPFRSHAVKSIIAVVSKPCQVGTLLPLQKLRALLFTDEQIALTLVTPIENFVAKDAKYTKNVIGFDAHHVFTLNEAKKKPEGTADLHRELNYDDYCIDFTLKSRGNVFVTDNFLQAKGPSKKQFVQTAAHNIVQQLVNYEQGLDCVCKMNTPYTAQNVCSVVYSNEKAAARKGGHKG